MTVNDFIACYAPGEPRTSVRAKFLLDLHDLIAQEERAMLDGVIKILAEAQPLPPMGWPEFYHKLLAVFDNETQRARSRLLDGMRLLGADV